MHVNVWASLQHLHPETKAHLGVECCELCASGGMRFRIGLALLCCSPICCVAQLILHLHLAWLCNCVCCIQGNTFSSMYFAECFVFRNFRLFLHRCEPHVRPWLLDMRLATVCIPSYPFYRFSSFELESTSEKTKTWRRPKNQHWRKKTKPSCLRTRRRGATRRQAKEKSYSLLQLFHKASGSGSDTQ